MNSLTTLSQISKNVRSRGVYEETLLALFMPFHPCFTCLMNNEDRFSDTNSANSVRTHLRYEFRSFNAHNGREYYLSLLNTRLTIRTRNDSVKRCKRRVERTQRLKLCRVAARMKETRLGEGEDTGQSRQTKFRASGESRKSRFMKRREER